jgi:Ca-activated chloride channel family protein
VRVTPARHAAIPDALGSARRVAVALIVAVAAAGVSATGGQDAATFHAGIRTVAMYATVLDRDHHLVTDLTRDDFEVRDNGKPVTLSVFSADAVPITIAIMLDTSGSMRENLPPVVHATEDLIARLTAVDAARVGTFGDRILLSPRFTSDHDELLRFLHTRARAGGETPLWNAVDLAMVYLKDVPGRRVVLVFTDGFDTTTLDHGFDAVTKRADSEEIMVYAIGCWGGPASGEEPPDKNLRKLADRTGGGYVELTWTQPGDLAATFARVADELHHQYVLGFTPAELDGRVHTLDIRVRRSGLTVRARKSYVASR